MESEALTTGPVRSFAKRVFFGLIVASALLLVLLGVAEAGMRIFGPPPLEDNGKLVRTAANPAKQYELLPGAQGTLAGAAATINSFGCRDREYPLLEPEGTIRIVGIGDSLTFGHGVREEDSYLAKLESELQTERGPVEVINCGVFGYNVDEECVRFREVADLLHPDIIVIGYELGDILRNPPPRKEALAVEKKADGGAGQRKLHSFYNLLRHSRVLTTLGYRYSFLLKKIALRNWDTFYADGNPLWENLNARYSEMAETARRSHIDVAVVIIPELSNLSAQYPFKDVHARVRAMCERLGMHVIDALPSFLGEDGPSLWVHPQDRHPNAHGHRIIARALTGPIAAMAQARAVARAGATTAHAGASLP